jgi:hypothetical protein
VQCANAQDGSLIDVQEGLLDAGQSKKAGGRTSPKYARDEDDDDNDVSESGL